MRRLIEKLTARLPLQFRVLYRQFLLRVIDLEALSIQADIPRFLGQFAGVLIMFSLIQAVVALLLGPPPSPDALLVLAWHTEQSLISTTLLVVGLVAVVTWDTTFPDRRDILVLGPLPVSSGTILSAKVAASATILGIAILSLNFASGLAWPLVLGGARGVFRFVMAFWFTIITAAVFLYGTVLAVQGMTALLLPRRLLLRISGLLQLAAFAVVLGFYFFEPSIDMRAAMEAPSIQRMLGWSPVFWFFALFNQLNGSLPESLVWLARRAWLGLAISTVAAAASLVLCYVRTMKKTVEEPDLVPSSRGFHSTLRLGSSISTAILLFTLRSLTRSRHHRVVFAFFLALACALPFGVEGDTLRHAGSRALSPELLASNFIMMCLVVMGLRCTFSLPISLTANWVLRTTQLAPLQAYVATRRTLLLFGVLPALLVSACLSLPFRPLSQVAAHLAILGLVGGVVAELALLGFRKIPFTCSYLPGKVNVQFAFWGSLGLLMVFAISFSDAEMHALHSRPPLCFMIGSLIAATITLRTLNRLHAKKAVLFFEESPPEIITKLGLVYVDAHGAAPKQPAAN